MANLAHGLITIMLLFGCAGVNTLGGDATAPNLPRMNQTNQVIVKFRDTKMSESQRDSLLHEISHATGARLIYLRPLSGDAQLLGIEGVLSEAQLQQIIGKLRQSPGVEYAESNRRLHHMQPN